MSLLILIFIQTLVYDNNKDIKPKTIDYCLPLTINLKTIK